MSRKKRKRKQHLSGQKKKAKGRAKPIMYERGGFVGRDILAGYDWKRRAIQMVQRGEESTNKVTVFCDGCGRKFKFEQDEDGNFVRWIPCECGQEVPVKETRFGTRK
jgi:hypothetical protein